jgi:hypothetical protein
VSEDGSDIGLRKSVAVAQWLGYLIDTVSLGSTERIEMIRWNSLDEINASTRPFSVTSISKLNANREFEKWNVIYGTK